MVQHLVVEPVQSLSAVQNFRPLVAVWQDVFALLASDVEMQAWPIVVSHVWSLEQNFGHADASLQTLPPAP
jgi:hypothetical protein